MADASDVFRSRIDAARRSLEALPIAKSLAMQLVELGPGVAAISLPMRDDLRQPGGVLHGGVTATLIDTAMAYAVRTVLDENEASVTVDLTIHFLRPHVSGVITCTARILRAGKRILTVSADVLNEEGKLVATAVSTYTRI